MIRKLLVANRGEIAVRVIRTAHALGKSTVAVFSDADAGALHVRMADEAVRIGPAAAVESYLDPARILDAAARTGADAVHPGYGFLSENAAFAQAVIDAGLTWVGPPPEAIATMGDKSVAKERMRAAGVPVVPGREWTGGVPDAAAVAAAADEIGYPLLVKAAFGGGGRGMRRVDSADGLTAAMSGAHAEAEAAFGRGDLLLERLVEQARHVEVQVFADAHGRVVHLGERECSVQRRHQKVIEEAPSPAVSPFLRAEMGKAAVAAAAAVSYVGAGTVEFLLAPSGAFYFLEMNTRLQVEHPVTELVTGLDLVELQLRVAEGEALSGVGDPDVLTGHAIEARLYAEDPAAGFLPQTGDLLRVELPDGVGVRCDHGLVEGGEVTADYDPMIAKVIAHGPDRETARMRLRRALTRLTVLGVTHNAGFLVSVLEHADFVSGAVHTGWLEAAERHTVSAVSDRDVAVAARLLLGGERGWRSAGRARGAVRLRSGDRAWLAEALWGDAAVTVSLREVDGESISLDVKVVSDDSRTLHAEVDGVRSRWRYARSRGELLLQGGAQPAAFVVVPPGGARDTAGSDGRVRAPMSGRVVSVSVSVGDRVERGATLLTLEAMKLQSPLLAPISGAVTSLRAAPGEQVRGGAVLVEVEADEG